MAEERKLVDKYVSLVKDLVDEADKAAERYQKMCDNEIDELFESFKGKAMKVASKMDAEDVVALIDDDRIDDESKYPIVRMWADDHAAELMLNSILDSGPTKVIVITDLSSGKGKE